MRPTALLRIAAALGAGLCAALPAAALAEAGRLEFVSGAVNVRNPQGMRPGVRGADLEPGDTVMTADGRAQIRFRDGAYVSLQPNTEFAIKVFNFNGATDGSERGVFGLVKGTMRTVTGLIGRVNRDAYKIDTPNATVGIRGTGGIISVGLDGATRIIGTSGVWSLGNSAGVIEIPAGRAGFAPPDQSKPPEQTAQAPQAPPAPVVQVVQAPVSKAEERTSTGGSVVAVLDTTKTIGIVYAEVVGGALAQGIPLNKWQDSTISVGNNTLTVKGTVGANNELTGFSYQQNMPGHALGTEYKFSGTLRDAGSDGAVSWGRWTGPVTVTFSMNGTVQSTSPVTYPANGGFHYALGNPATQMPTTGSFTYTMIGATAPTSMDAAIVPGTVTSGQLVGLFTPTGGQVNVNIGLNVNNQNFTMNANGAITGNVFSGNGNVSGGTCSVGCLSRMEGGFAGVGATHAGVAYSADIVPGGAKQVGGVVVLKR